MTSREKLISVIVGIVLGSIAGVGTHRCNEMPDSESEGVLCKALATTTHANERQSP